MQQGSDARGEWISLGEVLRGLTFARRLAQLAALHDAIAMRGVWLIDTFDRTVFCRQASKDRDRACELVKAVAEFESGESHDSPVDYWLHPQESCRGHPDDPFSLFGWYSDDLPMHLRARRVAERTEAPGPLRPSDELLHVGTIAALLQHLGIDPHKIHTNRDIRHILTKARCELDRGTISKFLGEIRGLESPDWISSRAAVAIHARRQVSARRLIGALGAKAKFPPTTDAATYVATYFAHLGLVAPLETVRDVLNGASPAIKA